MTKNFGVWKEDRKSNMISYYLASIQFVVALSVMAFIVFLTLIVVVKIRQEFFLIESAPVYLFKDKTVDPSFFIPERPAAMSIFIKKDAHNRINIFFENGPSFDLTTDSKKFLSYLEKRKENIIYMAMLMRINAEQNSRIKIWTQRSVTLQDVKFIMKIFSQFGFDSFDIGVER